MGTLTAQHIRQALIQIAERNGYPHYSLIVQRAVIDAFRTGQHHHLKSAVMSEPVSAQAIMSQYDVRIREAKMITRGYGMTNVLAVAANMETQYLNNILCGRIGLNESDWACIEAGIKAIERKPDYYRKYRKAIKTVKEEWKSQNPAQCSNKQNVQLNRMSN